MTYFPSHGMQTRLRISGTKLQKKSVISKRGLFHAFEYVVAWDNTEFAGL